MLQQAEAFPAEVSELVEELESFINPARLDNVISKIGVVSRSDAPQLIGMFSKYYLYNCLPE
jgi:hypothetical protein